MKNFLSLVLVLFGWPLQAQQSVLLTRKVKPDASIQAVLDTQFGAYELVLLEGPAPAVAGRAGTFRLSLDASGTAGDVMLEPNDLRNADYHAVVTTGHGEREETYASTRWFKGYYHEDRRQPVRVSVGDGGLSGYFVRQDTLRFIRPVRNFLPGTDSHLYIVYPADAVGREQLLCETVVDRGIEAAVARVHVAAETPVGGQLLIATEASYNYYITRGEETNAHILEVLNEIEGLYERDFGVTFRVTYQHAFAVDEDPYKSNESLQLLEQFRTEWNSRHTTVSRNLAFLFNTTTIPSGSVGRAYQGQACEDRSYAYGYFSRDNPAFETIAVAHEIGHLLGALHELGACDVVHTLMCPSLGGDLTFSSVAQAAITDYLNSHSCFDVPLTISLYPVPARNDLVIQCSEEIFSVAIYDVMGRKVQEGVYDEGKAQIPVAHVPPGIYVAVIRSATQVITRRLEILR
ncbi:zinc-dependent metalloprotease [Parachryseolinea silvisoli]|jgi:hypothetical protein|uniref:zinc-dependent metalloprotease n=1 Tax=Parachryseolinea silvisoli TaxID=2873601 RepID=UPI002265F494|nr:zinc-dependent metalloprotease [Parachryseolinea silvisoli]MCD9020180.1 T9SS type A sorting domain-containing protein [Parachryseolinea silvisoli]